MKRAPSASSDLSRFDVLLNPPDIRPWLAGDNGFPGGVPGVVMRGSARDGPHVALLSLMHGNEISGAIVLDRLLRAGMRPTRGRISFAFVNIGAFARFDPRHPTLSRFIDEDINRLWDQDLLNAPRHSSELDRARALLPLIETADVILDLHSMLWPSEPLILCGTTAHGRALARAIGWPPLVVADSGHANGRRMIDHERFLNTGATALLVEAGQHWSPDTVDSAMASVVGLLRHLDMMDEHAPVCSPPVPVRVAQVTEAVVARTSAFAFTKAWHGGEVVEKRDTLIATDGMTEIRTPYDNCLLVMPSLRPGRGHTAIRLARFDPSLAIEPANSGGQTTI